MGIPGTGRAREGVPEAGRGVVVKPKAAGGGKQGQKEGELRFTVHEAGCRHRSAGKGLTDRGVHHLTYLLKSSLWLPASELDGKEARCDVVLEGVIALRDRNDGDWTRELAVEMGHLPGHVREKCMALPVTELSHLRTTGIHGAI